MAADESFRQARYLVHRADAGGVEREVVMRRFDSPLRVGQELAEPDRVWRVVSVAEATSPLGLGHVWCEPSG
jgi:hypothetical protein